MCTCEDVSFRDQFQESISAMQKGTIPLQKNKEKQ